MDLIIEHNKLIDTEGGKCGAINCLYRLLDFLEILEKRADFRSVQLLSDIKTVLNFANNKYDNVNISRSLLLHIKSLQEDLEDVCLGQI